MTHQSESSNIEIAAINKFSEVLNATPWKCCFTFVELCEPPEPDCLCILDGQKLYVEVTHLYRSDNEARQLLGRKSDRAEKLYTSSLPIDTVLIYRINKIICKKSSKNYQKRQSRCIWLLIRSAFPLWRCNDFKKVTSQFIFPETNQFDEIFLLCHQSNEIINIFSRK